VFPKIGEPQNGWFIMENPIKKKKNDDLEGKPTIFGNIHMDETKTMAIYNTLRKNSWSQYFPSLDQDWIREIPDS